MKDGKRRLIQDLKAPTPYGKIFPSILAFKEDGEKIILKTFGSHYWRPTSLPGVWRPGYPYLTNKRLFLFRKKPAKILFEAFLDKNKRYNCRKEEISKETEDIFVLLLENDGSDSDVETLRTVDIRELKRRIEERLEEIHRLVKVRARP